MNRSIRRKARGNSPKNNLRGVAAIASKMAANRYQLQILGEVEIGESQKITRDS